MGIRCYKCGKEIERGFILDEASGYKICEECAFDSNNVFDVQGNVYSVNYEGGITLAEQLRSRANEIKDKWINIRCTEQERQDITEQAKSNNMSVAEYIRYLAAKERKEREK